MTDKQTQGELAGTNAEKDPADWVTGDEPMTGAQHSYLKTLSEQAKVEFDGSLNKADASRRIDELQHLTGRGLTHESHAAQAASGDGKRQSNSALPMSEEDLGEQAAEHDTESSAGGGAR